MMDMLVRILSKSSSYVHTKRTQKIEGEKVPPVSRFKSIIIDKANMKNKVSSMGAVVRRNDVKMGMVVLAITSILAIGTLMESVNAESSFGTVVKIDNKGGKPVLPEMVASGKNMYVVWEDDGEIFFTTSTNGGTSFGNVINVSDNPGLSVSPQIAISGKKGNTTVYVVWQDAYRGKPDILLRTSMNNGISFGNVVNISNNTGYPISPQIAVSGGNVYVVWEDGETILFSASGNRGTSFGSIANISNSTASISSPYIAASGDSVYLSWESKEGVLFRASTDNGMTFSDVINLSNSYGHAVSPKVAASGTNVYAVWNDLTPGKREVLFRASPDNGSNFGDIVNISENLADSLDPQLAASGSNVYVVWQDQDSYGGKKTSSGKPDVIFRTSTNNGTSFGSPVNLSKNDGHSILPDIGVSGKKVYVIWEDNTAGKPDLLFKMGKSAGAKFGKVVNLSNNKVVVQTAQFGNLNQGPIKFMEVSTVNGTRAINSYSDTIVIKNKSDSKLESVRLTLSQNLAKSFHLESSSIRSIEPKGNVTVGVKLIGKPNMDPDGTVTAYNGYVMVTGANHGPEKVDIKVGSSDSLHYKAYIQKITDKAQQRYTRTIPAGSINVPSSATVGSVISKIKPAEQQDYQVTTASGKNVVTNPSDQLVIKNLSDKPLKNVRISVSSPSDLFLLDKHAIRTIEPNSEATVNMTSKIDGPNPHKSFTGEMVIAPEYGRPTVIPFNIPSNENEKDDKSLEVNLLSGSNKISTLIDGITIKNTSSRSMDNLRLVLYPSDLPRVFNMTATSFKSVPAGGEVNIDFKLRTGDNLMTLTNNYAGELIIGSVNHIQKVVIPIDMTWNEVSSKHFIAYSRKGDVATANGMINFLESKYKAVAERFGEVNSKTVIYILGSNDELKFLTDSAVPYYYSYKHDIGFIVSGSDKINEDALQVFVYRSIISNNPSYWNREKIMFEKGNWALQGMIYYAVGNMTGKQISKPELDSISASPNLEWYNSGTLGNYASTYTFFKFLEEKYGTKVIDRTVTYLHSVMTSDRRCDTLESCAVLSAVYDELGLDMEDTENRLSFDDIVEEWRDYLMKSYNVELDHNQE
jgi:hypothetical protein